MEIVKLEKPNCPKCLVLESMLDNFGLVPDRKVNTDEDRTIIDEIGVTSLPVTVLMDGDKVVDYVIDVKPPQIQALFERKGE